MGLFDKVSGFIKREAEDIGEVADRARDRLDKELTEREEELEMTPAEKLRALQRQARQTDDRIDDIMEKAGASSAAAEADAEVQATNAAPVDREPPSVTQIVLADGSVRSGDDPGLVSIHDEDPEDEDPDEGDLSWVAPREGEEAVVPAFSAAVGTAAPSGSTEASESPAEPAPGDDVEEAAGELAAAPATSAAAPEADEPPAVDAAVELEPAAPTAAAPAVEPPVAETPTPPDPALEELPPPPPPMMEPVAAEPEPPAPQVGEDPPRRETPAEIAARVVAELEQAVAEDPVPAPQPAAAPPPQQPEPTFDKTPAQRKYEEARKAADALLEELRGELKDDGQI